MEQVAAEKVDVKEEALDMKDVKSALPDEKRPKYVSILQDKGKSSTTPLKSPISLGALSSSTDSPKSEEKGKEKKSQRKPNPKFNKNALNRNGQPTEKRRIFLPRQEVVALPNTVETRDLLIAPENVLYFSGPGHYMSALYPSKLTIDGNEYNSVEHYYQACKLFTLVGKEAAAQLKEAASPLEVKKATKDLLKGKVPPKAVNEWKSADSIAVLKHAVSQKFSQNEDLKKSLLDTGDKILIQSYVGDSFYAVGATAKYTAGWVNLHVNQSLKMPVEVVAENVKYLPLIVKGKNILGWILMQVREELRSAQ